MRDLLIGTLIYENENDEILNEIRHGYFVLLFVYAVVVCEKTIGGCWTLSRCDSSLQRVRRFQV